MVGFLNGLWLSLFPEAWRKSYFARVVVNLNAGVLITGIAQMLVCLALLGWRYPAFVRSQIYGMGDVPLKAAEHGGEAAIMGLGPLMLVAYLIQPLSILLLYFMVEGVLRGVSVVVSHEPLPTLPLFLASLADARARAYRREQQLGPRVVDTVQVEGTADLLIASCRPKPWTRLTTIRYQDELYELAKTNQGAKPRQFLYLLRKIPASKLVRGVHDYAPDEALTEKERAALAAKAAGRG